MSGVGVAVAGSEEVGIARIDDGGTSPWVGGALAFSGTLY
jgi:hypothetical protein